MIKVHFLGIGGSGASAAAAIAQAQGFEVTGCDLEPHNEFTHPFKPDQLFIGHSPKHLSSHPRGVHTILAVTPAVFSLDPNNNELREAGKRGIEIMTWQQFLGEYLTKNKFVIAVCGTHGKTTTTAMIAKMLEDAHLDPTVELGAIVPDWKANYRIGKGRYFVVEADEFNDNFLHLRPDIAVVTNIEMDHPEYFKDLEAVKKSFAKFKNRSKKVFDKPNLKLIDFGLKVPGGFNKANASLTFQVGLTLGLDPGIIRKSLENYTGVGRRFEYIGDFNGAKVYSDFGHHPTEIAKTMEAAREKFPKERILLIYQPHMFSRTKALFDQFAQVFKQIPVDRIMILDIYPSREIDTGLVHSEELADAAESNKVSYVAYKGELFRLFNDPKEGPGKNDIIFFMGAGDIDKLAKELAG